MNKTLTTIALLITICFASNAQSGILRLIESGKFERAEKELVKDLEKKPDDIISNYAMAVLLIKRGYSVYNPADAYEFILKAKTGFINEKEEKELKSLSKIPLGLNELSGMIDSISFYALNDANRTNKIEDYIYFLQYYTQAPDKYMKTATGKRNALAFSRAAEVNTIEAFQTFINLYPGAEQISKAIEKRNSLAFGKVKEADIIQNYKNFISTYPDASEVKSAWERIHQLAFEEARNINSSQAYGKFIREYPGSKQHSEALRLFDQIQFSENTIPGQWESYYRFIKSYPENSWRSAAEDSMLWIGKTLEDWRIVEYCVLSFTGKKKNIASLLLRDMITRDGEKETLDYLYGEYGDYLPEDLKNRDYEIAEAGEVLDLHVEFDPEETDTYDLFIKRAAPQEKAFVALQRMISPDLKAKRWKAASDKVGKYTGYFEQDDERINDLVGLLNKQWDNSIRIYPAGSSVNSTAGAEFAPVISGDDKLLYFCGKNRKDNLGGEDIYVSKKTGNSWGTPQIMRDLSSPNANEAPECISADGTTLTFFAGGDLYFSEKTIEGWTYPVEFPDAINTEEWEADAVLTSDGKALIFSSTRTGGYNVHSEVEKPFHGDLQFPSDIYVSLLNDENEWGEPINLGSNINTPFCDRSPFLHPDMKTLYFSSDGHGGFGKLDVFKSVRLHDSCWNCWSKPENMGKEINSTESDWGYKISTDGEKAYFSKVHLESEDIFWLTIPEHLRPALVATISGHLVDQHKQPVSAEIRWEDLESGKNAGRSQSDPADGSFYIILPLGKMYGYYVEEKDYFPISDNLDLRKILKPVNIEKTIQLVSYKQMIEDQTAVPINNLFFNFAESTLLPLSIPELKRVAAIIRKYHVKVEISGHADHIGDDTTNQVLSERRANAVKNFLIREGCAASELISVGYGESKPVASNETESGRAQNRRVEMKFIK